MNQKEVHTAILEVISQKQPVKAKNIADIISSKYAIDFTRTDVNNKLYGPLGNDVVQNEFFQWSIWKDERNKPPRYVAPEEPADQDAVNIDSTVKILYSNGQEALIGFTRYENLRFTPGQSKVTYVSCKSPIARSLIGKKIGGTSSVRGFAFKIVQID